MALPGQPRSALPPRHRGRAGVSCCSFRAGAQRPPRTPARPLWSQGRGARPRLRPAHHWNDCPSRSCSSRRGRSPRPQNTLRCWAKEWPRKPWPRPSERDAPGARPPPPHNAPRGPSAPEELPTLPRRLQGRPCPQARGADATRTILTEGNLPLFLFLPLEGPPYSVRRRPGA